MPEPTPWTPNFGTLDNTPPTWAARRPLRIALLGDFGGGASRGRLDMGEALARRRPVPVEADTLEDAMARAGLCLRMALDANQAADAEVPLSNLDAFHPDALLRACDAFATLTGLRQRLNRNISVAKDAEMQQLLSAMPAASSAHRQRSPGATPAVNKRLNDFAQLIGRPSAAASSTPGGLQVRLRECVTPSVVAAPQPDRAALVQAVDAAISAQMCSLLHHPDFQTTESLWRGADFLVRRLETGPALQVHLIDLSAEELAADLGACEELGCCGLHRLLVSGPAEQGDGGYVVIAGLYHFEATPVHAELLGRLAKVATAAGAPLLTGLTPTAIDTLSDHRRRLHPLLQTAFAALRALPEAGRLMLLGPRFLLRLPYGRRSDPITSFAFEEFTTAEGLGSMLWGHPALLALLVMVGQGGNLTVADLPFHHVVDDAGDSTALPCTERFLSSDQVTHLARHGVAALQAYRGEPRVRLAGLPAVNGEPLTIGSPLTRGPVRFTTRVIIGAGPASKADVQAAAKAPAEECPDSEGEAGSGTSEADLDALLAGAAIDGQGTGNTSIGDGTEASATDADLEALLKSLG